MSIKPSILTLSVLSALAAMPVYAADATDTNASDSNLTAEQTLQTIRVVASPFSQQIGTQKLTARDIARRPKGNGNLTELLRSNTNVRFSNSSGTSSQAGEIAPDEVSIHGAKYYNNNFTIDGVSNNDNLHPGANKGNLVDDDPDGYSPWDLPAGGTQSFYIDTSLVKNLEVFDSNVSVKYGNFTGGVINAELITPIFKRPSGKIYYRTTRSSWAKYHIQEGQEAEYEEADNFDEQPQFRKQQYGLVVNQPLSNKLGLTFSYNRTESKIPFVHDYMKTRDVRLQTNETFMLRGGYLADNGDVWKATLMYAPHKNTYFLKNTRNGRFINTGGGLNFDIQWDKEFDWAKMKSYIGFKQTGNKIAFDDNEWFTYPNLSMFDWASSVSSAQIGGYGTRFTQKRTWTIKQDFDFTAFNTGSLQHQISAGWEYNIARAQAERKEDVTSWSADTDTRTRTPAANCIYCEPGQYYWIRKAIYPATKVNVRDNTFALYLQDSMTWKRLNMTLGLRYQYSQALGNHNLSPRFSASYDVFGDQSTRIFGGVNRYYSGSILSSQLRAVLGYNTTYARDRNTRTSTVNSTKDWKSITTSIANESSYASPNLKTPHSDEVTFGFAQRFKNHELIFKWVHREHKNSFARAYSTMFNPTLNRSIRTFYLTNNGHGKNDDFSITVSPLRDYRWKYAHVGWDFGFSYQKASSNNNGGYDSSTDDNNYEKTMLNGKLYDTDDLPLTDFGGKWLAFLNLRTYFPKINLNWDWRFSLQSAYTSRDPASPSSLTCSSAIAACGDYVGLVDNRVDVKRGRALMVDWHFDWKIPVYRQQHVNITLDVNNVFNKRVATSGNNSTTTYQMGRNFWLGASYNW